MAQTTKQTRKEKSSEILRTKQDCHDNKNDLFLPKNRVSYFIYKPARTLPPNSPFHLKAYNRLQLIYYKYQLATGLYMLNERERGLINVLVLAASALTFYHFIL